MALIRRLAVACPPLFRRRQNSKSQKTNHRHLNSIRFWRQLPWKFLHLQFRIQAPLKVLYRRFRLTMMSLLPLCLLLLHSFLTPEHLLLLSECDHGRAHCDDRENNCHQRLEPHALLQETIRIDLIAFILVMNETMTSVETTPLVMAFRHHAALSMVAILTSIVLEIDLIPAILAITLNTLTSANVGLIILSETFITFEIFCL